MDSAWNGVALSTSADGAGGELQPSSGPTDCISVPAIGDTESSRDGRKYIIKRVFVSGLVDTNAMADQPDGREFGGVYLALVLDTQANGATIASEDVYLNPGSTGLNMMPQPLRNLSNSKRFRILDSCYIQPGGAYAMTDGASTASLSPQYNPIFKLGFSGNIICNSTGTTSNITSASDNAIHLIGYTGSSNGTPVIYAKGRVRFIG